MSALPANPDGKRWDALDDIDRRIRKVFPAGMMGGAGLENAAIQLEIRLVCGFELFNTRPYHNYETWSHGYVALVDGKQIANAEDLDVLVDRIEAWKASSAPKEAP